MVGLKNLTGSGREPWRCERYVVTRSRQSCWSAGSRSNVSFGRSLNSSATKTCGSKVGLWQPCRYACEVFKIELWHSRLCLNAHTLHVSLVALPTTNNNDNDNNENNSDNKWPDPLSSIQRYTMLCRAQWPDPTWVTWHSTNLNTQARNKRTLE